MVRTQCFHCRGPGSIPGWGTKIPQAAKCGKKKKIGMITFQEKKITVKSLINIKARHLKQNITKLNPAM